MVFNVAMDQSDRGVAAADSAAQGSDRTVTNTVRAAGLTAGVALLAVVVWWTDGPFALTFDDAYYYFEVAQRIADEGESTFDGMNRTNGYHPLWMVVAVIPFKLGLEGLTAVRFLLGIQAVLWVSTWAVLAGVAGRAVGGWDRLRTADRPMPGRGLVITMGAVTLLVAGNPMLARIAVSGMESGLVLFLGALILAHATRTPGGLVHGRSRRWRLTLGLLLGLAVLARTDHILLIGAVGLAALVETRGQGSLGSQLRRVLPVLAPPAVLLAVYLAVNAVWVGSALQVSGMVKRAPLTPARIGVAVLVAAAVVAIIGWGSRARAAPGGASRAPRCRGFVAHTSWYGAFCLAVVVYYNVFQTQNWLWYYAPPLLWAATLLLLFTLDLFESAILEAPAERSPARAMLPLQAILGVPLLLGFVVMWSNVTDPHLRSIQVANRDAAVWISTELDDTAVLASWDAGVLGFFADQPVVNIDGVVNSQEWHDATAAGPAAVRRFLDRHGVTYIVNHGTPVDGHNLDIVRYVELIFGAERAAGSELVRSFPFTFSGTTVGSSGSESGTREMAVFIYRVPPAGEG